MLFPRLLALTLGLAAFSFAPTSAEPVSKVPLSAAAGSTTPASTTPLARTIPLQPAHGDVRRALLEGDDTAIADAFTRDPSAAGDGFVIRRVERTDRAAACARVQQLVDGGGTLAELLRPRQLQCLRAAGDAQHAVPDVVATALTSSLGRDPRLIADAVALVQGTPSAPAAVVDEALAPLLTLPLPVAEGARRAAVATGLRVLATRGSATQARAARVRLLDELPEQPHDDVVDDDALTPSRRIARATVLERLQKNDAVVDVVGDLVARDCEAALLVAKAKRKLRRYAEARQALAQATHERCGETRKKARYLELRVASIQKGASVEPLAKAFLSTWTRDPLADDVLLWLAETRAARGDLDGRDLALARIVSDFPDGDMADDARFRLALATALRGDHARATGLLDDAARVLSSRKRPRPIDLDRARYWRARLAVAPDPRSLDVIDDDEAARAGWAAVAAFARERGASFYGQLARRLLRTAAVDVAVDVDDAGTARSALAADATILVPDGLARDRRFTLARAALELGFDDEAAALLVDVVGDPAFAADRDAVTAVAAAFLTAGRPDRAHQTLRNAGFALLDGEPAGPQLAAWTLAWPRAFSLALEQGAALGRVPPALLFGLAREESAFDASIVSWAGAVGLCQLMPATALDEARALKLAPPSIPDLLDPVLNARLGGAHLGRRLKGMSHPLLAIAAYNAGPGAVAKWMPAAGQPMPIDLFVEQIPVEETRNYVKKVTGSWVTYAVLDEGPAGTILDRGALAFDVRVGR